MSRRQTNKDRRQVGKLVQAVQETNLFFSQNRLC